MAATTGPAQAIQCTIKAIFAYTQNATNHGATVNSNKVAYHEKTARITLTNLPPGVYQTSFPGEIIPAALPDIYMRSNPSPNTKAPLDH